MFCPFCGVNLPCILVYCSSCYRNVSFLLSLQDVGHEATSLDGLIQKYFTEGHSYEIIVDLLKSKHNISVSLRNLERRLKDAGLTRRLNYTPIATLRTAISEELKGSGHLLGYRAMWQILKQKHSFVVRRDNVMHLMAELDPCGTENRSRRRFVRRAYHSMGPNETWHVDGYDKLKPFGIAINGCIDGFSRKIMWLNCGKTNNDPLVIAQYYVNCIVKHGVFPKRLRTDCSTKNGTMAALHCTLRSEHKDEFAGAKSHMYGTSTSNQRIETWWSYFRKQRSQFWMDLLSDLRERHLFNGSPAHTNLVRYCFLGVLQKELDEYKHYWNTHTIRPVRQSRCPSGKPEAMYYVPQRFDGSNCGFPASAQTLNHITSIMPVPATPGGDEHETLFGELQQESGLRAPVQWESAVENYITLKTMAGL
uniref:Integrase core domain-containing protein n=1 Tax=Oryzias latipes TaxID=8090 RepID=A0A3P9IEL3_ORYLA